MERRQFLHATALTAASGAGLDLLAASPMPETTLGKSQLRVSKYVVGGYHMAARSKEEALRIIRRARELGVTFFDSANAYHKGGSDELYGQAFSPAERKQVILMTKCEDYSRDGAMKLLETQLKRMKTDYLDLWQCHQVSEQKEVDQILGPNGSLETFVKAKQQGKVRHIGFTGHRDPQVHLRLLKATDAWETIQMPVNLIDPHYLSFIANVLPEARKRGLGVLAMKSNAMGNIAKKRVATVEECLRFTWSQDVDVVVSGAETVEQLEQNIAVLKSFKKMTPAEVSSILSRTKQGLTGSQVEEYKRKENAADLGAPHRDGD
jgi:aryl-alcohol dehydrogenase-like predicted oxidoreductase